MLKYFFKVDYQKKEPNIDDFALGIFSSKANADKKIDMAKKCMGFDKEDGFVITKFGVNFPQNIEKPGVTLYSVEHEYSIMEDGVIYDIVSIFDILGSFEEAQKLVEYLKSHSCVGRAHPDNFEICENVVDDFSCWSEGFDSY